MTIWRWGDRGGNGTVSSNTHQELDHCSALAVVKASCVARYWSCLMEYIATLIPCMQCESMTADVVRDSAQRLYSCVEVVRAVSTHLCGYVPHVGQKPVLGGRDQDAASVIPVPKSYCCLPRQIFHLAQPIADRQSVCLLGKSSTFQKRNGSKKKKKKKPLPESLASCQRS